MPRGKKKNIKRKKIFIDEKYRKKELLPKVKNQLKKKILKIIEMSKDGKLLGGEERREEGGRGKKVKKLFFGWKLEEDELENKGEEEETWRKIENI